MTDLHAEPYQTADLRQIRRIRNKPRVTRGEGFAVAQLHAEDIDGGMDPFLMVDAFALSEPFFAPHPHAGFNAVTYILPESPIGFINRDSLGNQQRIAPGGLHWTTAGRGVQHEEVPEVRGTPVLGLQMFINLPSRSKHIPPGFLHLEPDEVPVVVDAGATVRVVFGQSQGRHAAIDTPTPGARLIDVTLAPGAHFQQSLRSEENCFLWVFQGSAHAITPVGEVPLAAFDFVGYDEGATVVAVRAGPAGARIVLAGGVPLDEPVVAAGPFVMSTELDIQRAFASFRAGQMGTLSATKYGADLRPLSVV